MPLNGGDAARQSRRWPAQRVTLAIALLTASIGGCTDPTAIGDPPEFLYLVPLELGIPDSESPTLLPADSCPPITPPAPTGPGRRLSSTPATIALPPGTVALTNPFGRTAGEVFRIPAVGIIAIAFDDLIPAFSAPSPFRPLSGVREARYAFGWQCSASIGSRAAALYLSSRGTQLRDGVWVLTFGGRMAITTIAPDGRRVNISLKADLDGLTDASRIPNILQLINLVGTIRWQP